MSDLPAPEMATVLVLVLHVTEQVLVVVFVVHMTAHELSLALLMAFAEHTVEMVLTWVSQIISLAIVDVLAVHELGRTVLRTVA